MKYKMPSKADLKGRSSTISNAFAISITPYITPAESEVEASYEFLKIKEGQCAYCLGEGNSKDHLKPLVRKGMPTGYINKKIEREWNVDYARTSSLLWKSIGIVFESLRMKTDW